MIYYYPVRVNGHLLRSLGYANRASASSAIDHAKPVTARLAEAFPTFTTPKINKSNNQELISLEVKIELRVEWRKWIANMVERQLIGIHNGNRVTRKIEGFDLHTDLMIFLVYLIRPMTMLKLPRPFFGNPLSPCEERCLCCATLCFVYLERPPGYR